MGEEEGGGVRGGFAAGDERLLLALLVRAGSGDVGDGAG